VLFLVAGMAALGALTAYAAGERRFRAEAVAYRVEVDLRGRVYAHVQRLHQAFHDATSTGELMSRTANDLQQIRHPIVNGPLTIANVVMLLGSAAVLLAIDPLLAVLALAPCSLLVLLARRFRGRLSPAVTTLQAELGGVSTIVEEAIGGIRAVKGLGLEGAEFDRLERQADQVYRAGVRVGYVRASYQPLMEFLPAIGLVFIGWLGGQRVASGGMSLGGLVQFTYYLLMLVNPLRTTGQTVAQLHRALVSAGRVSQLLRTPSQVTDSVTPRSILTSGAGRGPAQVRFDGVRFGYTAGRPVLDGIDLVIAPGETIAVVGPSGSGKTTLASLVSRTYDVAAGSVRIDGIDVRDIRLAELRRAVSTVFEETFLFSGSLRDNIAFADPALDLARVRDAARLAGADDFIEALPDGYDTEVGGRGRSLSGGQRQRVALARAVITEPRVLILDDVMSAVDASKEAEMRESLKAVIRGYTTILIAHRAATIALAQRVVLLDGGRIAAVGTHAGLLATSPRYRQVLAMPARQQEPGPRTAGSPSC
jgi:ATP-binding cassette subfamily B protein